MSNTRPAVDLDDVLLAWDSPRHNLLYNGVYVMDLSIYHGGRMDRVKISLENVWRDDDIIEILPAELTIEIL